MPEAARVPATDGTHAVAGDDDGNDRHGAGAGRVPTVLIDCF
jgi:hypothetical protein